MEQLPQHIGSSKVQGHKAFMHDLIIEAISHHHVTFDTLKSYLSDFNEEIYHDVCEKAITYYDMFAPKTLSPLGIEHVRAMTSFVVYKIKFGSVCEHSSRCFALQHSQ